MNRLSSTFTAAVAPNRLTEDRASAQTAAKSGAPAKLHTVTIYQDQFCRIVSDDSSMTKAQGQAMAAKVEAAWQYDLNAEQWKNTAPLGKNVLVVEALTKSGFDSVLGGDSTGVAGVTMGPNLMAVPETLTNSTNPDDDDTIAHELNHVMDFREAPGATLDQIPVYEQEGKAYSVGDGYPIAEGKDQQDLKVLGGIAQALTTKWTEVDARDVMDHFRTGQDENNMGSNGFRDEILGALYVQFLKADFNGGSPDAIQKLAQITSDVGNGMTYDDAFQKQFGASSKSTEDAFVQFMKDTDNDPTARLKGTIWAPYLNAAPATNPTGGTGSSIGA